MRSACRRYAKERCALITTYFGVKNSKLEEIHCADALYCTSTAELRHSTYSQSGNSFVLHYNVVLARWDNVRG